MCLCFDSNFDEFQTNENIYLKTAQPLISHVFNGGKVRERERERECVCVCVCDCVCVKNVFVF